MREEGWFENGSTIEELDTFTRYVGMTTKTSEIQEFWNILYFSWSVTTVADLKGILGEQQVRYLTKLGDYVRIIKYLPEIVEKAGDAKITVEQVLP